MPYESYGDKLPPSIEIPWLTSSERELNIFRVSGRVLQKISAPMARKSSAEAAPQPPSNAPLEKSPGARTTLMRNRAHSAFGMTGGGDVEFWVYPRSVDREARIF